MAARFPDPTWAVEGIIAEGLTLLVGAPKVGKSWLGLGVSVSVAAGGGALGSIPVDQGPALVLALEDTARRLQSRLRLILNGAPAPDGLTISIECPRIGAGAEERISHWLDRNPDARLVVVDVLAKVRGVGLMSESAYSADYHTVGALKEISDRYGVPFLVLHHPRKQTAEDWLDTVSGTTGLAGAADSIALLKRTRDNADGILSVTGRDIDETEYALRFHPDIGSWQLTDIAPETLRRTDNENAIIAWLTDHEGDGPAQVAKGAALDYEATKKAMARMKKRGQLDSDGHGRYFLPITTTGAT
ncbi:MAG: AAA family ATPase [Actinomycetota bacterium]